MSLAAAAFLGSVLVGLVVLGAFLWRLFLGVRSLGRTVSDAAVRIETASAGLPQTNAEPYTRATPRLRDDSRPKDDI